jgi:hypothetical protein
MHAEHTTSLPPKHTQTKHTCLLSSRTNETSDEVTLEHTRAMPKIELHAHLSGSIRDATIQELLDAEAAAPNTEKADSGRILTPPTPRSNQLITTFKRGDRTLDECFRVRSVQRHVTTPFRVAPYT